MKGFNAMRRGSVPRIVAFVVLVTTGVFVASCSKVTEPPQKSIQELYKDGMIYLQLGAYDKAAQSFRNLFVDYPYSSWSSRGLLLSGYANYLSGACSTAQGPLSQFIRLYPKDPALPYAYYLQAICYYEQMGAVHTDQTNTQRALNALNEVILLFPNSEFATDARLKKDVVVNQLAGKDMYIGRFYERMHNYTAAIRRYEAVVQTYSMSPQVPEALFRMVESYYALNLPQEAYRIAATLGFNYPHNIWNKKTVSFLHKHPSIAKAGPNFPIKKQ